MTRPLSLLLIASLAGSLVLADDVERPLFKPLEVKAPFWEQFTEDWGKRWQASEAVKNEEFRYNGQWKVEEPTVYPALSGDKGLVVKSAASHHAISASFEEPLDNKDKTLVVQYEVKMQNGLECGGAYLKLLTQSDQGIKYKEFDDKTPYTIMFGPDKCGATNKVHFIFRHKNPITGEYEEKHLAGAPISRITKLSTLYTLVVRPDNTYEIKINDYTENKGNLLENFEPAVNPPKEIDDPEDKKPSDWVDDPKIPDPDAKKPSDWDEDAPMEIVDQDATKPDDWYENEPETIPDPEAEKPEDWDDEEDGEWISPQVPNPKCENAAGCGPWTKPMKKNPAYKGKWYPPMIDNPAYKGEWAPRKIPNPNHFEDAHPSYFEPISGIGFELWTMQNDILFDNIYVGHSEDEAHKIAEQTWAVKNEIEKAAEEKDAPKPDLNADEPTTEEPIKFVTHHVNKFIAAAKADPVAAAKEMPYVAGGLAAAAGSILLLISGLFSSSPKAPVAPHKKSDEPNSSEKSEDEKVVKGEKSTASRRVVKKEDEEDSE
ncbi:Calreticulin-domain-containing protein [Basidiobolus meristosporus CBS 931.73]|uniref:Calreticulin-domain-containing protein n=1 Tax=Basidiobolus meristosporus CBS 931.73 TaxID=1314790 RepID=A0A1Y1Z3G0_9FUNG|nr:Calreticulin-domain-containing protein [Basidiobolus meristosporus CBS 931.73]|eukprot:ORY04821.1 Calreticulin-domain-containing protein [Basidiobolus meristosporus CBS 931.73]